MRELQLQQFQAALFCDQINIGDKLGVAKALQERVSFLDGEPLVLPLKDTQAPPEVPRIFLKSDDQRYSLNLAKSRFDFINRPGTNNINQALEEQMELLKLVLSACQETLSPTVNRLGFVIKVICMLEGSSNELMLHKFIQASYFNNTNQIQLNVLNKFKLGFFEINRWIKIHSLRNTSDPLDDKAISLELDINTPPERAERFNFDAIIKFFEGAGRDHLKTTNELISII